MHGGYSEVYDIRVCMYLTEHWVHTPIDRGKKNINIVYNDFMSDNEKWFIFTQMRSELSNTRLSKPDIFGDIRYINNLQYNDISVNYAIFENKL